MRNYLSKFALVAVGMVGGGILGAAEWDKKTTITTDEAMQLPNTMLQPGTYVIRLADSDSNRHIVQFFDKDEKHLITTVLAIPNERVRPRGKSVFAFWEVPAGQPPALRAWFYPGDNFGQEFAYPKVEADRISASNNNATVPIGETRSDDLAKTEPVTPAAPDRVESAPLPAPGPVEVAAASQNTPAPEVQPVPVTPAAPLVDRDDAPKVDRDDVQSTVSQNSTTERLPKTGSDMPLFGAVGLLALAGALALKVGYKLS